MQRIFNFPTLAIISSAFLVAALCLMESTRHIFPFWIIARGSFVMDTLFHELGHSIFGWLFGFPNIPMIFTIFQSDKMGGMALMLGHLLILQFAAVIALGYACYYIRGSFLYIPLVTFTVIIAIISASGYGQLFIDYMGHGSATLVGGFFLYRAWANIAPRGKLERWLNAYFGAYLTLGNTHFAYKLITDSYFFSEYTNEVEFIGHRDFVKVAEQLAISVNSVAIFTIILGLATIAISAILAAIYSEDSY